MTKDMNQQIPEAQLTINTVTTTTPAPKKSMPRHIKLLETKGNKNNLKVSQKHKMHIFMQENQLEL